MKKRILFISTHNLASNPRLVKEIESSVNAGYHVTVICFRFENWSDVLDQKIKSRLDTVHFVTIEGGRKPILFWLKNILTEKASRFISLFFSIGIKLLAQALSRRSAMLIKEINNIYYADLIIGHNPGAMYPTLYAAKKFNAKSIFDLEDFHRGEQNDNKKLNKVLIQVESYCIPKFDLLTAASSSIADAYLKLFSETEIITINNVFTVNYLSSQNIELSQLPLKLFWFSQKIGKDRGLETILQAMQRLTPEQVSLTLLGDCSEDLYDYFNGLCESLGLKKNQLTILKPVPEHEIASIASQHHIGIASEITHMENRNICLTNKIFMYLLSGNALLMSDTKAQKQFWYDNPQIGMCYDQNNPVSVTEKLKFYIQYPEVLMLHRNKALNLAREKYNWENEQHIYLTNLKKMLDS